MNRRRAGAVALVLLAAVASWSASARADYVSVGDPLVSWDWARSGSTSTHQVTDIAVRPDGWLVVATATGWDGHLHLVPPWGGTVDDSNRFGPTDLGFRQLEVSRGRLFGLRQENERTDIENHAPGELYELDLQTGDVRRELGTWWYMDLATDPLTGELVLQTSGDRVAPYRHDLVRFDPDTGVHTLLRSDNEPDDDPLEVAYSGDGQRLFVGHPMTGRIDVLGRDGGSLFSFASGPIDALVGGRPGTCHDGALLATRSDGSVLSVRPAGGASTLRPIATGGRPGVVSYASLDNGGHLVTARLGEVVVLGCPGFVPPKPPAAPDLPAAREAATAAPVRTAAPAPVSAPTPSGPGAPPPAAPAAAPAPPPPPPPAAPPAPPTPVAVPSALGPAVQAAAAPTVGIADVPDQEHITSLAASRREPTPVLLYGAAVALSLAAYAVARRPAGVAPVRHGEHR